MEANSKSLVTIDEKLDRILKLLEGGDAQAASPFSDWHDVPLVCSVKDAARVLNRSTKYLYRRLESGAHMPGLMPREGQQTYRFSRKKLQEYVEGGYATMIRRKRPA